MFEKKVTTDAPKGDTFFILIRITGVPEGPNGTLLQSSFKVTQCDRLVLLRHLHVPCSNPAVG